MEGKLTYIMSGPNNTRAFCLWRGVTHMRHRPDSRHKKIPAMIDREMRPAAGDGVLKSYRIDVLWSEWLSEQIAFKVFDIQSDTATVDASKNRRTATTTTQHPFGLYWRPDSGNSEQ